MWASMNHPLAAAPSIEVLSLLIQVLKLLWLYVGGFYSFPLYCHFVQSHIGSVRISIAKIVSEMKFIECFWFYCFGFSFLKRALIWDLKVIETSQNLLTFFISVKLSQSADGVKNFNYVWWQSAMFDEKPKHVTGRKQEANCVYAQSITRLRSPNIISGFIVNLSWEFFRQKVCGNFVHNIRADVSQSLTSRLELFTQTKVSIKNETFQWKMNFHLVGKFETKKKLFAKINFLEILPLIGFMRWKLDVSFLRHNWIPISFRSQKLPRDDEKGRAFSSILSQNSEYFCILFGIFRGKNTDGFANGLNCLKLKLSRRNSHNLIRTVHDSSPQ